MYPRAMKSITITIPEKLDAEAAAEARRRGISKSELIRRGLAAILPGSLAVGTKDPWAELAGFAPEDLSAAPGEIDDVVYRP